MTMTFHLVIYISGGLHTKLNYVVNVLLLLLLLLLLCISSISNTVKSHFKALGLYNFIRGQFLVGLMNGRGGGRLSEIRKMFRNNEIKRI